MKRLKHKTTGVVVNVDDKKAKRLESEGYQAAPAKSKTESKSE